MSKIVGMSRNINIEWLNLAATLVLEGKTEEEIKEALNEYLSFTIESATNLRKSREILMNIWARNSEEASRLKSLALEVFNTNKAVNKLVAHWCRMLLVYPVFKDIVNVIGKMSDKQFDLTNSQLKTRMYDVWGERSTLLYSIDKNIKTLKDIGVIETIKTGHYKTVTFKVEDSKAINLIIATLLATKDKLYVGLNEIEKSYEFFPFSYEYSLEELQESELFSFDKFGGEIAVSLNK